MPTVLEALNGAVVRLEHLLLVGGVLATLLPESTPVLITGHALTPPAPHVVVASRVLVSLPAL